MNGFRARLLQAIESSDYSKSVSKLSKDSGLGAKTLSNVLNDERLDTAQHGPGIFGMARVCEKLGVSLDWLANVTPPIKTTFSAADMLLAHTRSAARGQIVDVNQAPTPEAIMRLHMRTGGMLEGFNDVLEFCDVYAAPTDNCEEVEVISVGERSLSAITMETNEKQVLQSAVNAVDPIREMLISDHREAVLKGCIASNVSLDQQMPNKPVRVKIDYIRVLASLRDVDGKQVVLNYSSLIL